MKKIIVIALLVVASATHARVQKVVLQANGLTCSMCSKSILKALQTLPFAEAVSANIQNSTFEITMKTNGTLSFDAIKEKVEGAGFFVADFTVFLDAPITLLAKVDEHQTIDNYNVHVLKNSGNKVAVSSFKVVDKGFVSEKAFKRIMTLSSKTCVKSGKSESCCEKESKVAAGVRMIHITV